MPEEVSCYYQRRGTKRALNEFIIQVSNEVMHFNGTFPLLASVGPFLFLF